MVEGSMKNKPLGPIGVQARTSTGEDGIPISSILGAKLLKNVEMSYDKGKKKYLRRLRLMCTFYNRGVA